jgi:uncharacterized membrane protein
MKEMWAVLGFVLLVGLLILRMIEEQRREVQRTEVEDSQASRIVKETTASHATVDPRRLESHCH